VAHHDVGPAPPRPPLGRTSLHNRMHTPTNRRRDPRRSTPSARVALPHKALYLVGLGPPQTATWEGSSSRAAHGAASWESHARPLQVGAPSKRAIMANRQGVNKGNKDLEARGWGGEGGGDGPKAATT